MRQLCWFSNKSHSRRMTSSSITQSTKQQIKANETKETVWVWAMREYETQANAVCFTHTSHITSVKLLCDHLLVQCWVIANHHESRSPHHAKIAAQNFLCAGDEFQHTHSAMHQISPVRCWFGRRVRYVQGPGKKCVVGLVRQLRVSCSQNNRRNHTEH